MSSPVESPIPKSTRFKRIVMIAGAALIVLFLGVALTLRWFVNSGRLQALVERRAGKSSNVNVRMGSFHFSWPMAVRVEGLTLAAPGYESNPFLTCQQLKLTTSPGDLVRGHLLSLTMLSPKIELIKREDGFSNLPHFPKKEEEGFSLGTITINDAEVNLDFPGAKASIKGAHATYRKPILATGEEKLLGLTTESARFVLGRSPQKQVPIEVKIVDSKFVVTPNKSSTEIEASIESAVTARVPYLLLPPDIPVGLSLAFDYVPQRDTLENAHFVFRIPLFTNVSAYGAVAGLTSESPSMNLNVTVQAPEIGDLLEYCEPLQRPRYKDLGMTGNLRMTGQLRGSLARPEVSVHASSRNGKVEWKGFEVQELSADMPINITAEGFAMGPGAISAGKAFAPIKGSRIEAASLSASVSADNSRVSIEDVKAELQKAAKLKASGSYEFAAKRFRGSARMDEMALPKALELVPPGVYRLPEGATLGGALNLSCDFSGKLAGSIGDMSVRYSVNLRGGEFSKGEFMSVAGINAKISGSMQSASPKDLWKFDGGGDVGNFEVLVDTFYKSFSDSVFPFSFAGKYTPAARKFQSTTGALDLGEMGKFKASGDAQLGDARRQTYAQLNMRMNAEKVNVGNLFEEIGQQALSEVSPAFRDSVLGGMVSTDFRLGLRDKRWTAAGTFAMADGRVALDGSKLVVESLTVRLPFALYFPQNENQRDAVKFADPDFGKIQLQGIKFGPAEIPSLAVDVALKENALRARGPIPIALFDGKVTVSDIQGENLLGRSAALTTSALVEGMDVGQITTKLGLPEVLGRLDARFPAVRLGADALEAEGAAEIRIFGGAVSGTRLGIEEPFSPVRTFRGDLTFKDIDLSQVTETLKFGRITGVMEGSVKGLEISQGQAAAFVADFETVPRKRVPQTINFDAVQNITILGTGQGFQATLGRGFASFFDEFKYRKIGFYCSLKNDNFRMKGKVVQGETEYFVKGIMLGPSINVINRNPGQTVSFKSMLERISRVKREKGSEESGE